ncbi:MAG: iron-containing alcohol dehydrogenase [Clostridiales Family XIII bacterium]|jgi:alcohol dehydrogenase YqhD (iron-dependent ADH family)|nr:iron-containing alcohol dehydrogenase [Clostridiales Family XIII bacterium]
MNKIFTDFTFKPYTEIVFGRNTEAKAGELIKKYGGSKVLLVYGSGSIKKNGLYDRVVASLNGAGLPFAELGGVHANPRRSLVEEGIKLAHAENADFFLAVGGGSTIDTAKGIAIAVANGDEYWSFYLNGTEPPVMAPVGTIHTIAAAGSETSDSTVLVDDIGGTGLKKGLSGQFNRPQFAIFNPELTYTLPAYQTGAGSADIFAHTYMRYLSNYSSYIGDKYGVATLRTVVKYAPVALADPEDYEARAQLMLAGAFSHSGLTALGREDSHRGGEHQMEHQLSGYYDTAHGAGLSVIMPAFLKYIVKHGTEDQVAKVAQLGIDVFGIETDTQDITGTALLTAERLTAWLKSIGMPVTLTELGVPVAEIDDMIQRVVIDNGGLIDGFMDLDEAAIAEVYRIAAK